MNINRESFIEAVSTALKAERDGEQYMNPGIAYYKRGDEITCRYESELSPTERICFDPWDAAGFGIHERISEMTDNEIGENAAGVFEIFEDEILEDLLDVLNDEY